MNFDENPHRRYNPLTESWVLVSPHRAKRPWQGQVEKLANDERPAHDPECYLCAGNTRANGEVNPNYEQVYVFDNDFAALLKDTPDEKYEDGELFLAKTEKGVGRVICFSPAHNLTVPEMSEEGIRAVVDAWVAEYNALGAVVTLSNE